jgi:hypothetical protein
MILNQLDPNLISIFTSFLTSVTAITAEVFWWTSWPKADFPFTKQNGTSNFRQSCGNHKTNSIGSTLLAITTNFAFFS